MVNPEIYFYTPLFLNLVVSWWDSLGTPWDSHGEILLVHHEILMVNSKNLFFHPPVLASRGLVVRISWCTTRFSWWDSLGVPRDSHGQFILRGVRGLKCQCCKTLLQLSNFSCLLASIPSPTPWPYLLKKIEFSILILVKNIYLIISASIHPPTPGQCVFHKIFWCFLFSCSISNS